MEDAATKIMKTDNLDNKFTWTARPILPKEFLQNLPIVKVFVGKLKSKKDISRAIISLSKILPCPSHLKRCSELRIFLAPVDAKYSTVEELKEFLATKSFDLGILEEDLEIAEVPIEPPKTSCQISSIAKYWPVNFHPDPNLEALISGSIFKSSDLTTLQSCFQLLIEAAKNSAVGSTECNGSAIIVDPEKGEILAMTSSRVHEHPMWHAAMLAVDLVAKFNGGGAWNLVKSDTERPFSPKRPCVKELPLTYPESLSEIQIPSSLNLKLTSSKKEEVRKVKLEKCGPYLCTNFWAFLLQEPCPMCAMALLHSRISRIFYGARNECSGVLGSKTILHSVPGLNHRYLVWSGILEKECQEALKHCRIIGAI